MSDISKETAAIEQCVKIVERLRPSQAERVSRMLVEYFRQPYSPPSYLPVHTAAGGVWNGER